MEDREWQKVVYGSYIEYFIENRLPYLERSWNIILDRNLRQS